MSQKKSPPTPETTDPLEMASDVEETSIGEIRINHSVIATIVKLAAIKVDGVLQVGGAGFVDEMVGIFSKRESGTGITVDDDESGNYVITIRLVLAYGTKIHEASFEVQTAVRDQILQMTNKTVSKVNVVVEGVKIKDRSSPTESEASEGEDDN